MTDLRFTRILVILLCHTLSCAAATRTNDKSSWPLVEIRLSKDSTLKDLFDSGLRPYRFPSLESSMLETKHIRAVVVQPNGFKLPVYEAETITIHPLIGGKLFDMEFQNPRRNLEDSRAEMMRWIHLGTMPKRTEQELDEFLDAVRADPINYSDLGKGFTHNFAIHWRDEYQIRYTIWFHQIANAEKPLAVFMKIGFERTPREIDFYSIPIPPPLGYEYVDMTAPKDFGPDSEPIPSMEGWKMPDYSKYPKTDIRSKVIPPGHTAVPPLAEPRRSQRPEVTPPTNSAPSLSRWVWILGMLGILVAAWIVHTFKKHHR